MGALSGGRDETRAPTLEPSMPEVLLLSFVTRPYRSDRSAIVAEAGRRVITSWTSATITLLKLSHLAEASSCASPTCPNVSPRV
jgi:hypothetical protein